MGTTQTARFGLIKPDEYELVNPVAQIADNMQKLDDGAAQVGHAHTGDPGDGQPIQASGLADNAVTDSKIGNRTPDHTQVPVSPGTGMLTSVLSWYANRFVSITGGINWWDAPVATIFAIWSKFNAITGHTHTGALDDGPAIPITGIAAAAKTAAGGTEGNRIAVTDPNGRVGDAAKLGGTVATSYSRKDLAEIRTGNLSMGAGTKISLAADPASALDAAPKQYVDTAQAAAAEESLVVESVAAVTGAEATNVQTTMGPAVEFADGVTQGVMWNRVFPFGANACKLELRYAADVANAGSFRIRVARQVNGGAATNVDVTITPGNDVLLHTADLGIIVPDASVNAGDMITFTLSRLGADAADTHTGKLLIYQTRLKRG